MENTFSNRPLPDRTHLLSLESHTRDCRIAGLQAGRVFSLIIGETVMPLWQFNRSDDFSFVASGGRQCCGQQVDDRAAAYDLKSIPFA